MNRIELDNRVAVVTGGAQGLGRAIAERLTASGARVVIRDGDSDLAATTASSIGACHRRVGVTEVGAPLAWSCSTDNSFTTAGVFDISGGRAIS